MSSIKLEEPTKNFGTRYCKNNLTRNKQLYSSCLRHIPKQIKIKNIKSNQFELLKNSSIEKKHST